MAKQTNVAKNTVSRLRTFYACTFSWILAKQAFSIVQHLSAFLIFFSPALGSASQMAHAARAMWFWLTMGDIRKVIHMRN
jgi:hypothetical protein